ncbi:hypothetical protein [Sphingopyxis flava]|uniref:Uncharacterized protein n=1 Tax=Sphingopyxis flava TaxID=1507287 RepID=A0A1T5CVI3_9SPHN|nr:hypothetical protein [Sphingopyxis flava]SKB63346.1 hypothetical protein SAMN06295937_1011150 [Sphingopyxis flava]
MIVFGSLIFWIALAVSLIVPVGALGYGADRDEDIPVWFVALWLTALAVAAHFFVDSIPLPDVSGLVVAGGIVVYLAIGLGWAALRWREEMIALSRDLADRGRLTRDQILSRYGFHSDPPSPRDRQRWIGSRIAYWPFYLLGEFTSIFTWVGQAFDFVFRAITKRVFESAGV